MEAADQDLHQALEQKDAVERVLRDFQPGLNDWAMVTCVRPLVTEHSQRSSRMLARLQ